MLYAEGGDPLPFREPMNGTAPWWFAFEENTDAVSGEMVVGDKGVVIRGYAARLGGVARPSPSLSILCDKLELGTPAGLTNLVAGDFVNISLELVVLPRAGAEYERALGHAWDARGGGAAHLTLRDRLNGMRTSERVRMQALGGELDVAATRDARVESRYPIRVRALAGSNAMFDVHAKNATELASAMADWCVGNVKADGRWCCALDCP